MLFFVEIGGKVDKLWGIYARLAKKTADSSQLIL